MGQGTSRGHFEPYPGLQVDDDGSDVPGAHRLERPATGRSSFSSGEGRGLSEMGGRRSFQGRPSTASSNKSGLGRFADPIRPTAVPRIKRPERYAQAATSSTLEGQMGTLLQVKEVKQRTEEQVLEEERQGVFQRIAAFIKASARPGVGIKPKLPVPPNFFMVPEYVRINWHMRLQQVQEEMQKQHRVERPTDTNDLLEPKSQADLALEVQRSLGSAQEVYSAFSRTVNRVIQSGLSTHVLQDIIAMDEEVGKGLSTREQWQAVGNAVEGVLQVYVNRANSRPVVKRAWQGPSVLEATGFQAQMYTAAAESMHNQGKVGLVLIDDGRLLQISAKDIAALLSTDLWQAIKAQAPLKVPSSHRLERLSLLGRHVMAAVVATQKQHGKVAISRLKVVLCVDALQQAFVIQELQLWSFFGLLPKHVAILPLPRHHGLTQDASTGELVPSTASAKLLLGPGYAMFLLNAPAAAFQLDAAAQAQAPTFLPTSTLHWLRMNGVVWLLAGLFSDLGRMEAGAEAGLLAGALYASEREGATMAVQAVRGHDEREARAHNSIILGHAPAKGSPEEAAQAATAAKGERGAGFASELMPSALRTVQSSQVLKDQITSGSFYLSTQRYALKLAALQTAFNATGMQEEEQVELLLHGNHVYGTMSLSSITRLPGSKCVAVAAAHAPRGPTMDGALFGQAWLGQAAAFLQAQDKEDEFRQKAISLMNDIQPPLLQQGGASMRPPPPPVQSRPRQLLTSSSVRKTVEAPTQFKEHKGMRVLLVIGSEHRGMPAAAAMRLARLSVKNISDRLNVLLILGPADSISIAAGVLGDISDKELEFNSQLSKHYIQRQPEQKVSRVLLEYIAAAGVDLVVVPSLKLSEEAAAQPSGATALQVSAHSSSTGGHKSSMAFMVARAVVTAPVLVVKMNSAGRFAFPPATVNSGKDGEPTVVAHPPLHVMVNLEIGAVAMMVHHAAALLPSEADVLVLAKMRGYERPGQVAMRTERMLVKARMVASGRCKVEERAYAGTATQELPKACEEEGIDVLMLATAGELPISKVSEELLIKCKASVLLFRSKEIIMDRSREGATRLE